MDRALQAGPETSSLRLVLSLAVAGLLSGLVLVGVYLVTQPRIERNRAEALNAAIFRVLPGTVETTAHEVRGATIYRGRDAAGEPVGFAIPASGAGFQDTIALIYGYDPVAKVIIGMEVLESRETPGLGDKIIFDEDFLANFEALAVSPAIEAVKQGKKNAANQVDCITGATISSEAVVKILNESSAHWLPLLEEIGDEPANDG